MEFEPIDLSKTGVVLPLFGVLLFIVLLQVGCAICGGGDKRPKKSKD
jgi:hypothetical protein